MAPGSCPMSQAKWPGGDEEAGRSEIREDTGGIKAGGALGRDRREPQHLWVGPTAP